MVIRLGCINYCLRRIDKYKEDSYINSLVLLYVFRDCRISAILKLQ